MSQPHCPNCGAPLKPGVTFCPNCGTPVSPQPARAPGGRKLTIIIAIICAVIVVTGAAFLVINYVKNRDNGPSVSAKEPEEDERSAEDYIDLGYRYLRDGKYDKAILAFENAIDIDSKLKDAYIGLSEVYIAIEDYDRALDILEEGFSETGDSSLEYKIDSVTALIDAQPPDSSSDVSAQPETSAQESPPQSYDAPSEVPDATLPSPNIGTPDTIKIGLVAPMTGDNGVMGMSQQHGYEMAIDEINAAGGVKGKTLELVIYNDYGDPQEAVIGAQRFADDESVLAIGGSCNSSSTLAMIPIIDAGKLPDLVVSSSSAALTGSSDYFFRMSVQDAAVGPLMADALLNIGKKNIVVFYPNNDYGKRLNESIAARITGQGGRVLGSFTYLATDVDFTVQLTSVKNLKPDAIALAGVPSDSGLLIKQIKQLGIDVPIIGGTALYNAKTIEICGTASENLIVIGVYVSSNPDSKVQELVSKYVAKYGSEPDGFAALAYDQMYVIAAAAERAIVANNGRITREMLRAALKDTAYDGVTGYVSFNEVNDWVRPYLVLTVKNGAFVMYEG